MNNLKNLTVYTFICEIMDALVQAPSFKFRLLIFEKILIYYEYTIN